MTKKDPGFKAPSHFTKGECLAWRSIVEAAGDSIREKDRPLLEDAAVLLADLRMKRSRFNKHAQLVRALDRLGLSPASRAEMQGIPKHKGGRPGPAAHAQDDDNELVRLREESFAETNLPETRGTR